MSPSTTTTSRHSLFYIFVYFLIWSLGQNGMDGHANSPPKTQHNFTRLHPCGLYGHKYPESEFLIGNSQHFNSCPISAISLRNMERAHRHFHISKTLRILYPSGLYLTNSKVSTWLKVYIPAYISVFMSWISFYLGANIPSRTIICVNSVCHNIL